MTGLPKSGRSATRHGRQRSGCAQEDEIMKLWEAGLGSQAIVRETGFADGSVRRVLGYMVGGHDEHWQRGARTATDKLAARIIEVWPERGKTA